ncbi:uncharacterized protein BXZ73DRAFT_45906 [Epithele typhae]|uniref:uncharacterized protein n=1 Tax=Epithele typhae TaxID=378194 RepID=UPI002008902E|nr:uncharacterized protein BXZ73DRAFT_45906 [Epithele typhae]KAH9933950.1 hypothetical protein BXZ73DRAFT_45906 [Epithele typhae]
MVLTAPTDSCPPSSPVWARRYNVTRASRRRFLLVASFIICLGSVLAFFRFYETSETLVDPSRLLLPVSDPVPPSDFPNNINNTNTTINNSTLPPSHDQYLPISLRPETYVRGKPTAHFRDSLRDDVKYMTSFLGAGFTNDQITLGNLIYLSKISGRVPVLPPLTSHIDAQKDPLDFSRIFDLPRLTRESGIPILEWSMIKDLDRAWSEGVVDELGCWNIWQRQDITADGPRRTYTSELLKLDLSHTLAPGWVKLIPNFEHDKHSTFWTLAKLLFPAARASALADPAEHPTLPAHSGARLPPDEQMGCIDYLYYTCAQEALDFAQDYSPMWRDVMTHAHWTPEVARLGASLVRATLAPHAPRTSPPPPFIALHARHGDFAQYCDPAGPRGACFAPLSAFAAEVERVRDAHAARTGVRVEHVVMTSDERDPGWWAEVAAMGWHRVDVGAARTPAGFGEWWPVIADAVVQSMAVGFVGTEDSTFSLAAKRRVEEWNGGEVAMVKWR